MLKVLFAGLGAIGQRHLRNLREVAGPDVQVAAYRVRRDTAVITDRLALDTTDDVERRFGVRAFADLDEALASFAPQLAFICNPTSLHLDVALKCAQHGCHLFIEKPLSSSLDGTESLASTVEERGLVALVGFQHRFHPCYRRLRELLRNDAIGKLVAVRARYGEYLPGFHPYEDYRQSYAARSALGGGVVLTQIHDIDYLVSLLGMPTRVFAMGGHLSSLEVDVEDVASIMLEVPRSGVRMPVHLHQDFVSRVPVRACTLIGDDGAIEVDFRAATVALHATAGPAESESFPEFQRNDMFIAMIRHLLACIEGEAIPEVGVRDAIASQRVAAAVLDSLRSGDVQRLPMAA